MSSWTLWSFVKQLTWLFPRALIWKINQNLIQLQLYVSNVGQVFNHELKANFNFSRSKNKQRDARDRRSYDLMSIRNFWPGFSIYK